MAVVTQVRILVTARAFFSTNLPVLYSNKLIPTSIQDEFIDFPNTASFTPIPFALNNRKTVAAVDTPTLKMVAHHLYWVAHGFV